MKVIAISGKGGTGKTTLTALIVKWLGEHRSGPILAVDADPCLHLGEMLGVTVGDTVGAVREEMKRLANKLPGGMTKQQFLEYKIHSSLIETPDFDLIGMGRPEGPGCYCYANSLLRDILDTLGKNYRYLVIDNEAGMEHISRRTTRELDYLLMISDPTVRGIRTAGKISRLTDELAVRVRKKHLILNRVSNGISDLARQTIDEEGLDLLCTIPEDDRLLFQDRAGRPIWEVLPESGAYTAIDRAMNLIMPE